jgi:hypothetical protein
MTTNLVIPGHNKADGSTSGDKSIHQPNRDPTGYFRRWKYQVLTQTWVVISS